MCMMLLANQIIQQQKRNKENIILSIERVIHIILFLLANGYFCRGWNTSDIFCDYNLFPVVHSTFWFSFHSIFLSSALSLSFSFSFDFFSFASIEWFDVWNSNQYILLPIWKEQKRREKTVWNHNTENGTKRW